MTSKTEIYYATRKTARAHVYITKGVGKVRINNVPVEMIPQETAREVIFAPLEISGDLRNKVDISVRVKGGGFMGQASAAATAISRALTGWTRAKPFTDFFPKALIPVEGKPLIDHIVSYLSSFRFIDEILIVSDFKGLGEQIRHYFENRINGTKIKFVQDSGSGTAGDLLHASGSLKNTPEFLLWFVDNLCAIDIKKMIEFFKQNKSLACIATRTTRKEETGFAVVNDDIITEFKEH